jgi:NAD-dependent DNA ligase
MDDAFYNRVSSDRLSSRQIDELIGVSRGLCADGHLNQAEAEFRQKWLAANQHISDQPVIRTLFTRVNEMLSDGVLDAQESVELLDTLESLGGKDFELGETLKASSLPLCQPQPDLGFDGISYCFTGTFVFGKRKDCEQIIIERGGLCPSLTQKTDILVVGAYATDSWKHSSFGTKILKAAEWRAAGIPISIVSEEHWTRYL